MESIESFWRRIGFGAQQEQQQQHAHQPVARSTHSSPIAPLWLRTIRSAVAINDPYSPEPHGQGCKCSVTHVGESGTRTDEAQESAGEVGGCAPHLAASGGLAASAQPRLAPDGNGLAPALGEGLTRVRCSFVSPLAPDGPSVEVDRALVDTGSSDCELLPQLLARLQPLPVVAHGAVYETSIGGEEYEAYEVLLTVQGRTCAAVLTCSDACSSDAALIGHMAVGALDLLVDSPSRRLVPRCRFHDAVCATDAEIPRAIAAGKKGELQAAGRLEIASTGLRHWPAPDRSNGPLPVWLSRNASAVPLEGLDDVKIGVDLEALPTVDQLGRPIVPVTYVPCCFASPLNPSGPRVVVYQALVDTGAADCELREGLMRQLAPLPVVARGIVYETVAGRVLHDSFEVLVHVGGRSCAAVATVTPDERFAEDSEDPNTDEAIIGYAALAAMRLVVDCRTRSVL